MCGEAPIGFRHQDEFGRRALVVVKLLCYFYETTVLRLAATMLRLATTCVSETLPPVEILGFRRSNNRHLLVSSSLLLRNIFGVNIGVWSLE